VSRRSGVDPDRHRRHHIRPNRIKGGGDVIPAIWRRYARLTRQVLDHVFPASLLNQNTVRASNDPRVRKMLPAQGAPPKIGSRFMEEGVNDRGGVQSLCDGPR